LRDHKGVHIIIVRFDRTDSSSKNRSDVARYLITELGDAAYHGMSE
jgi:hypothetical protein